MSHESAEQIEEIDYEARAKEDGWMPQDQWKGDQSRWVDAKTFVERGQQFLPIVQAKYRKTLETVESLRKEVDELKVGSKEYREFAEKALARERQEKETKIAELEALRKKAISEGDGDAFDKADKKLTELRQEPPAKPSISPETQAWLSENTWYTQDPVLRGIADGLSDVVAAENPGLKGRVFLDKLRERVQAEVPHKFQNSRRETSITEDHQRKTPSKKGRTYEDLPAEAKGHCERFMRTIPGFTKEAFLSQYDWSE